MHRKEYGEFMNVSYTCVYCLIYKKTMKENSFDLSDYTTKNKQILLLVEVAKKRIINEYKRLSAIHPSH